MGAFFADVKEQCPWIDFSPACAGLAALDLRPELGKVTVPALVLVGEQDEAPPPPMSRELAASLPNARLKVIAGCAHVPQLQAPEIFLDAIGGFLPEISAAGLSPTAL